MSSHHHAHEHPHHDHGHHGHGHEGHSHAPATFGAAFAIGITLNAGFVVAEVIFGLLSHSLALVADAGHNFGDVLGLVVAWIAVILSRKKPTQRHTYGYKRASVLAAFCNALFLLISMGVVAWEAIRRINSTAQVDARTVIWVSAVGILINGITAFLFMAGRKHDLNIRAAFLHMAGDALISAGVVVAGAIIAYTNATWIDPVMSLVIVAIIVWSTWKLLQDSVNLAVDAVPDAIDPTRVRVFLTTLPGVIEAHDLHIWALSTTQTAMTVHLVLDQLQPQPDFIQGVSHELEEQFNIHHVTIQVEPPGLERCLTTRCDL